MYLNHIYSNRLKLDHIQRGFDLAKETGYLSEDGPEDKLQRYLDFWAVIDAAYEPYQDPEYNAHLLAYLAGLVPNLTSLDEPMFREVQRIYLLTKRVEMGIKPRQDVAEMFDKQRQQRAKENKRKLKQTVISILTFVLGLLTAFFLKL